MLQNKTPRVDFFCLFLYFLFHFSFFFVTFFLLKVPPPTCFFPIKQTKASHYLSLFLEAAQSWSKQTDNSQSQIKKTQTPLFKTATQHSTLIKILINHFLFLSFKKKKRRKNENLLMSWSWIWNHLQTSVLKTQQKNNFYFLFFSFSKGKKNPEKKK